MYKDHFKGNYRPSNEITDEIPCLLARVILPKTGWESS